MLKKTIIPAVRGSISQTRKATATVARAVSNVDVNVASTRTFANFPVVRANPAQVATIKTSDVAAPVLNKPAIVAQPTNTNIRAFSSVPAAQKFFNFPQTKINVARTYSTAAPVTVKVPSMGDSISDGTIHEVLKKEGDYVAQDEVVLQIETDKVTVDVRSPVAGTITSLMAKPGETVAVGQDIFAVAPGAKQAGAPAAEKSKEQKPVQPQEKKPETVAEPAKKAEEPKKAAPSAAPQPTAAAAPTAAPAERGERRVLMSRMRQRIAARLKDSQNTAAMLTQFNEIDMHNLMNMRADLKDEFEKKHGVKLGFMSAFVKACAIALQEQPVINAVIDGDHIIYRDYIDISVAVATPSGLVVPVVKNCDKLSFAGIEKEINSLADRARKGTLAIEDMTGGTFTISNGGVFGSMMGTPIINPPQSGIFGMHAVKKRPVVLEDGTIAARPMMYTALTYDHRLIDGREATQFLLKVKSLIEDPRRMLLEL
eukprot:GEZU01032721.1.p1 GENE.GEZU01032721.1~~GEZU01032721.1.p1  ORF type:complete len:496 (-),score=193.07 GEZU01032721.1:139-1590(-)